MHRLATSCGHERRSTAILPSCATSSTGRSARSPAAPTRCLPSQARSPRAGGDLYRGGACRASYSAEDGTAVAIARSPMRTSAPVMGRLAGGADSEKFTGHRPHRNLGDRGVVTGQVVVGDGPEGLAISPAGGYAASLILNGTGGTPKSAFYRHDNPTWRF